MFFLYSFLHEIAKCEDILPGTFLIIQEKIPMPFTHMDSTDSCSLQSCLIDEFPCRERLDVSSLSYEILMTTDKCVILFQERITEKWSTRKSWWLLESTKCLEICWCICLVGASLGWDIEEHVDDKISLIPFEYTFTVAIVYIYISHDSLLPRIDIEYRRFDEEILHLEPETPRISDTRTTHRPWKSDPRYERRYAIVLIELACEHGRDLTTLDTDKSLLIMFVWLAVASETIMDEYPFIPIESKKTVRPSSDDDYRKPYLACEPKKLRQQHDIISRRDIEEIFGSRLRLECGKERYVRIFLEEVRCLHEKYDSEKGEKCKGEEKVDR